MVIRGIDIDMKAKAAEIHMTLALSKIFLATMAA
jgi:hypothetical protein